MYTLLNKYKILYLKEI